MKVKKYIALALVSGVAISATLSGLDASFDRGSRTESGHRRGIDR